MPARQGSAHAERIRTVPRTSYALAAYVVITLVATWPLTAGLGRDVAWDLGDPVLNMWTLAWDCEQIRAIAGGDVSRARAFFDANIFYPAPVTLAYSEHLFAQAIQICPVYVVSGNPILSYNLLFLSTFVLCGLGMYLFVRELTGNAAAAFVAGLIFAFVPSRLPQSSQLQILSAQWMPFALYGLRRYFDTRRVRPLAGAALALVAQNLSCSYYLLFFPPFAAVYAIWEIARRRLWRDGRAWRQLACAAGLVIVATAPFLVPYAHIRGRELGLRSTAEVSRFSADVYSYATAFGDQRVWGRAMRAFPKSEGELFPGVVPVLLAAIGIAAGLWSREPVTAAGTPRSRAFFARLRAPTWLTTGLAAVAAAHAGAAAATILMRRLTLDVGPFVLRMGNVNQLLLRAATAFGVLLLLSPAARERTRSFMGSQGFFVLALVLAVWLSLGPLPQSLGRPLEIAAPYRLLFDYVPGFDGLRMPARFAMMAMLMIAVLAGYGAAILARSRGGRIVAGALAIAFLIEATHVPFPVNRVPPIRGFNTPEPRLYRPARAPTIYREIARQASGGVVAELPLGEPLFDVRAMYYSIVHWRPVLNGYSGFYPPHYDRLRLALGELPRHPELSLAALRASGATHVLVHEGAYLGAEGPDTSNALRRLGAVELYSEANDVLLALPREGLTSADAADAVSPVPVVQPLP